MSESAATTESTDEPTDEPTPAHRHWTMEPLPTMTNAEHRAVRWRRVRIGAGVVIGVTAAIVISIYAAGGSLGHTAHTNPMSRYLPKPPAHDGVCSRSFHDDQEDLDIGVTGTLPSDEVVAMFGPMSPPGVIAPPATRWRFREAAARCWEDDRGSVQVAVAQFGDPTDAHAFFAYAGAAFAPDRTDQSAVVPGVPGAFIFTSASDGELPPTWSLGEKGDIVFVVITVPGGDGLGDEDVADPVNGVDAAKLINEIYSRLP